MRIWDVEPCHLCNKHLVAEHRELHGLWNILTIHQGVGGYSHHPETKRWVNKQKALYLRHEALVEEFKKRNFNHSSPLDKKHATGALRQDVFLQTIEEQIIILNTKPCQCRILTDLIK